jgi:arylsulfatase
MYSRRSFLGLAAASAASLTADSRGRRSSRQPNFVVILTDDLGFGDVGFNGSSIRTPNLDRLASAGVQIKQFYSGNPVCSPSRAAFLTGRYPTRMGIPNVIYATDAYGLPSSEMTLGQMLRGAGYATGCVGKWHLGSLPEFMPRNRGFDEFYGVPYSNDMWPLPLISNGVVVESETDNNYLTQKYTAAAVNFIQRHQDQPFFLYLAHNVPHVPIGASPMFHGKSPLGPYADAVEEMDWSVGQVVQVLESVGVLRDTLCIFTSDNGPWAQGSPGRLRGRKGETYEGGVREPFIAYMPGQIEPSVISTGFGSLMDLFPTFASLTGARLPSAPLDGVDLWPVLSGNAKSVDRGALLYFDGLNLQAARLRNWKLHVSRCNALPWVEPPPEGRVNFMLARPELYDIEADPSESYECSEAHPEVVNEIQGAIQKALLSFPNDVHSAWMHTQARGPK